MGDTRSADIHKIGVLLIAPPMTVVGGQSVQARRLYCWLGQNKLFRVTFQATTVVHRCRYFRTILNSLLYVFALLRRIPRSDVVHIFTAGYLSFVLVALPPLLLSRLFRKKSILHYHDGRAGDHFTRWPSAVKFCRMANVIVTPTGFLVDTFAKFGLRAYPIANTLERDAFPYRLRTKPAPIFFHNRGLEEEYNVVCTLRAFALVQKRYLEAQLMVANEGSLRKELEITANSLGLQNVVFTGAVSQTEILELYDKADIFLSSADVDNMPGSVLEAFASGLAVIATRAGGTEWLVRDSANGILVDCGGITGEWPAALRILSEAGLAERLATTARQDVAKYSWAENGWRWEQLYTHLVSSPSMSESLTEELECSSR